MTILLIFAFLAGIVTVLSPCILPVLPIILSGSVSEGKKRPLGIVAGFIASFTFFTLFLSTIVSKTGVSAEALRTFSVIVVIIFGLSLLIPVFTKQLEKLFSYFSKFGPSGEGHGFWGGFMIGLSLGLVWTPCVGPILASVISLAITGSVSGSAFWITLAYSLGTGLPMLAITYGGRNLLQKSPWLLQNTQKIQKVFGIIMIITGLAIFFNVDRKFQTWILDVFPGYGLGLTSFEDNQLVQSQLNELNSNQDSTKDDMGKPMFSVQDTTNYPTAPELIGGTKWLNSEPLTLEDDLRGKVVLVDFWTYSCINCIRTFPYITQWYEKYKDMDFVIIGVHSPEFEFEKNDQNVLNAMEEYGITYPVVMDNDFRIWRAYQNRYWPAHYLIDKNGKIRYTHFGEGQYQVTENKIRELLGEEPLSETSTENEGGLFRQYQTPETYLGYLRAEAYSSQNQIETDKMKQYQLSQSVADDAVGLAGNWVVSKEFAGAGALVDGEKSSLQLNFQASKVHLVLDLAGQDGDVEPSYVEVLLDNQPLDKKYWTTDMDSSGRIEVTNPRKYDIVDLGEDNGRHLLTLKFSPGVQVYAFTFGS